MPVSLVVVSFEVLDESLPCCAGITIYRPSNTTKKKTKEKGKNKTKEKGVTVVVQTSLAN
jgi:hypothetical protein